MQIRIPRIDTPIAAQVPMNVTWFRFFEQIARLFNPDSFRAGSSPVALAGVETIIAGGWIEAYDRGNLFDPASGNATVKEDGLYLIAGEMVAIAAVAGDAISMRVATGSGTGLTLLGGVQLANASGFYRYGFSTVAQLAAKTEVKLTASNATAVRGLIVASFSVHQVA